MGQRVDQAVDKERRRLSALSASIAHQDAQRSAGIYEPDSPPNASRAGGREPLRATPFAARAPRAIDHQPPNSKGGISTWGGRGHFYFGLTGADKSEAELKPADDKPEGDATGYRPRVLSDRAWCARWRIQPPSIWFVGCSRRQSYRLASTATRARLIGGFNVMRPDVRAITVRAEPCGMDPYTARATSEPKHSYPVVSETLHVEHDQSVRSNVGTDVGRKQRRGAGPRVC